MINKAKPDLVALQEVDSRIDYIFYQPASLFRVTHAEVIPESMASDHRPVLAIFEIPSR